MTESREPRDERGPGDPRDERDQRLGTDPRDPRDPRRPGDVRDGRRDRMNAVLLTLFIISLFLIDFFWSSHTANTAAEGRAQIQAQAIAAEQKLISANERAIASSCDFLRPLTGLPVTIVASTGKPSELSIQIITGAREQYAAQCHPPFVTQPLPPPDPSLVKWAEYYHIPVTY